MVSWGWATVPFPSVLPNFFFPKSNSIKSAPVIVAVVDAKLGSRSQHGPGSSEARADNSGLVGGRAALSGWQHLSEPRRIMPVSHQELLNPKEMTALCCINVAYLLVANTWTNIHWAQPRRAAWTHGTVCAWVWLHTRVTIVGSWSLALPLCLSLSLSLSLHLSHDFPDLGTPGVSHLGHQLHSQVNCSSKWSAKQCKKNNVEKRKKKHYSHDPPPCLYHQRMTRSEQKAGRKQADEWCERFAEALQMDEEDERKNGETETCHIDICIKHASVNLWVTEAGFFFKLISSRGNGPAGAN